MFVAAGFSERFTTTSLTYFWTISIVTQNKIYKPHFEKFPFRKSSKTCQCYCAYYTTVKKQHGTKHLPDYRVSHHYRRGYLEHSLNAVHHFSLPHMRNWHGQNPNIKSQTPKSRTKLLFLHHFSISGFCYTPVCGSSVGCLCNQIIMPQEKYL
jgi:hypothetical protein